ncbi:MAG: cytochrome c biogenesis protein ResB [Syntrophobacteraceae bacterium]|jgi:cytochrome c biogenesis protein
MPKEKGASRGLEIGWLSSLKLTLVLFFALAASSVVGTLLPQGVSAPELRGHFSPAVVSLIDLLGLNNLYHSIWFRVLLLLLCINMVACTVERLPKTVRLIRRPEDPFDSRKLSKFSFSASIVAPMSQEQAQSIVETAVGESFGPLRRIGSQGPFCAVSEKGRWSGLMVYGVHVSVLIVLVGAMVGSYVGFKGTMNLVEGETSDEVLLAGEREVKELPFMVRCDKFDVSFYDTGAPKEFRADLAIIDKGTEVLKEPVVVNGPLTYQGITFYQASYGTTLKGAAIELTGGDPARTIAMDLPFRERVTIPGTREWLTITEYEQDLMRFGQAIEIKFEKEGQRPSIQWILVDRAFHGNRIENYQVRVVRADRVRYTGLEVKKDPGVWLVWAGFTFMTLAIGLTFYSSHRKLWVCIEPDEKGKKSVVSFAGRMSRNAQAFEEKFESLRARLEKDLKGQF